MRLRRINFRRFRQFIDEHLDLDPEVTVLVGANDTGKTSILRQFFTQYVGLGASAGWDVPRVKNLEQGPIDYTLIWDAKGNQQVQQELMKLVPKREIASVEERFVQGRTHITGEELRKRFVGLSQQVTERLQEFLGWT